MDNYLLTISSANGLDDSKNCQEGQKGHRKITTMQYTLPLRTLVLLIIFIFALVTLPPRAISASCGMECCKDCNAQKCCKDDYKSDARERDSDKGQSKQGQQYEDIKCFNVCVESGYTCKHCEDACRYRK